MVIGKDEPQVNEMKQLCILLILILHNMQFLISIQITKPLPLYTLLFHSHLLTIISIGMRINRNGTVKG